MSPSRNLTFSTCAWSIWPSPTLCNLFYRGYRIQNFLKSGGSKHRGKTSFVEHRTFLHLYHSFHRLWIFLAMMFQVCTMDWYSCIFWFSLYISQSSCLCLLVISVCWGFFLHTFILLPFSIRYPIFHLQGSANCGDLVEKENPPSSESFNLLSDFRDSPLLHSIKEVLIGRPSGKFLVSVQHLS